MTANPADAVRDLTVERLEGIYVGMLTDDEVAAFNQACRERWAFRDYAHPGGFLGLAKVGIRHESQD